MKQFTERQLQVRVEAHNECLDFILNGYTKRVDFTWQDSWFASFIHRDNGNKINITCTRHGYTISKNGRVVKHVRA